MQIRHRRTLLFLALAGVVGLAVFAPPPGAPVEPSSPAASARNSNNTNSAAKGTGVAGKGNSGSSELLSDYPERAILGDSKTDLFGSQSWQPPPPPKVVVTPPPPPPPPQPPPMTFRFAGRVLQDGKMQVFVSKGDAPLAVKLGDNLDGYVVEAISSTAIALVYTPLGHKENILIPPTFPGEAAMSPSQLETAPMAPIVQLAPALPSAPAPKPNASVARVRWDGPAQVKVGTNFSVALSVNTDQPISGSPLQVRFNPAVLEPVSVRPGKLYAVEVGRGFTYRTNADGSIVVGATSQAASAPGSAELLVLTFKPKKNSTQAEISLTSLNLQGLAGRSVAHDALATFRATVTP